MTDGEYLMDYDELLERSKSSKIEKALLNALYPELGPNGKKDIQAQYMIDYPDMLVTLPDFAFPDALQIAIYCDGYEFHSEYRKRFQGGSGSSRGNYSCGAGASYASRGGKSCTRRTW